MPPAQRQGWEGELEKGSYRILGKIKLIWTHEERLQSLSAASGACGEDVYYSTEQVLAVSLKYYSVVNCKVRTAHCAMIRDALREHIPRMHEPVVTGWREENTFPQSKLLSYPLLTPSASHFISLLLPTLKLVSYRYPPTGLSLKVTFQKSLPWRSCIECIYCYF